MHDDYLGQRFKALRKGHSTRHFVPSPEGLVRFAVDGLAFALLPALSIDPHVKEGRLIKLLPERPYTLPLYWQTLDLQTPETNRLSQAIVENAQSKLRPHTDI
jgi:LysR family transcriptional regulator (chromosome initiation inhibitor)